MNLTETPVSSQLPEAEEKMFQQAVSFLEEIGITVHFDIIESKTFLPGISIANGSIVVDKSKLKYPGDILHEAGHIAVVPAADRSTLSEDSIAKREMREAEEMMAIAWSYAACLHLGIDAKFVFHDNGYKGGGSSIADNFREGRYFGVPVLKWVGMCHNPEDENGYPKMIKWLRE
ncbi:MAG TPA: hypothetical protein VFV31_12010 [Chitinophagaceae bacterium]|nr:hypothetical protein [Chitinophagaceae bacterium]